MKILYVTAGFFENSAISVRARFNVAEFCKNGLKTDVLTLKSRGKNSSSIEGAEYSIYIAGYSVGHREGLLSRFFSEILTGIKISYGLYKLRGLHDFYYLTSPPFFSALICKFLLNFLGLRHAIEVRDRYPQVLFDLNALNRGGIISNLLLSAEKYLYKNTELIFCVTGSQKSKIRAETGEIAVLARNGYDANLFKVNFNSIKFNYGSENCLRVITHGLFGKLFDEKTFLHLANHCFLVGLNVKFLLAGYGPKLDYLLNKNLGNVEYLGNLEGHEVADHLSAAHIGLSVHSGFAKDTFPVKIFEFIGSGLPSIIFPISEAGMEIESNKMGWTFNSDDVDECCALFEDFFNSNDLISSRVQAVLKNRCVFSRQTQALKIIEKIKEYT